MASLRHAFRHSARLQQQVAFLYNKGGMYTIYNRNLLYHGCIPLDEEGQFLAFAPEGRELRGRAYMDACDDMARRAYFLPKGHPDKQRCVDFLWYLWCGRRSPLFGREKITTFERYFVSDRSVWEEKKNPYYRPARGPGGLRPDPVRVWAGSGLLPHHQRPCAGPDPERGKPH